jgi:predicted unusual protein kinase regulating ubiquinone biosynthesis (AarF/ABC1/UbiB family)
LVLKGVEMEGNAVAYGTFGDIYKGQLEGKRVAIKVLRVYQTTNQDKLLKVSWNPLSSLTVI